MSDLQPSPDLQALFDRLEEKFKEVWANHYPSPSDTVTDAKPIITEWAKQHDEELATLRAENERLRKAFEQSAALATGTHQYLRDALEGIGRAVRLNGVADMNNDALTRAIFAAVEEGFDV